MIVADETKTISKEEIAKLIKKTEEVLTGALNNFPKIVWHPTYPHLVSPTQNILPASAFQQLLNARNIFKALQKYPLFDPNCLTLTTKISVTFENDYDKEKEKAELIVPVFGVARADYYQSDYHEQLRWWSHQFDKGPDYVLKMNWGDRFEENKGKVKGSYNLTCNVPKIPEHIMRQVEPIGGDFDQICVVWEANWDRELKKDPLIVGRIANVYFLLAQYDMTKLESYISSEFTEEV